MIFIVENPESKPQKDYEDYTKHVNGEFAKAKYKFLKNNAGELRLSSFDILHQNNSISRTTNSNYIEDNRTKVLQRYFMLTFTYTFRNFSGNAKATTD